MNRISISLKCGENISLLDEDDLKLDSLLEDLSTLFSINNVALLKTKTSSVIIRPSDISSIKVEPEEVETIPVKPIEIKPPQKKNPEIKIIEDIITDMD
jgi:hypothetical protein